LRLFLVAFEFIFDGGNSDGGIHIFVSHCILLLISLNALALLRLLFR